MIPDKDNVRMSHWQLAKLCASRDTVHTADNQLVLARVRTRLLGVIAEQNKRSLTRLQSALEQLLQACTYYRQNYSAAAVDEYLRDVVDTLRDVIASHVARYETDCESNQMSCRLSELQEALIEWSNTTLIHAARFDTDLCYTSGTLADTLTEVERLLNDQDKIVLTQELPIALDIEAKLLEQFKRMRLLMDRVETGVNDTGECSAKTLHSIMQISLSASTDLTMLQQTLRVMYRLVMNSCSDSLDKRTICKNFSDRDLPGSASADELCYSLVSLMDYFCDELLDATDSRGNYAELAYQVNRVLEHVTGYQEAQLKAVNDVREALRSCAEAASAYCNTHDDDDRSHVISIDMLDVSSVRTQLDTIITRVASILRADTNS